MADLMTEPSTPRSGKSARWPADAAPESWVNALFAKMHRMWGNTFIDKWPADDLPGVKIEWGTGLRKLSTAELKAGVDALLTLRFPPSLPEFYGLCKQMRLVEAQPSTLLTDQTRASPQVVEANLARMREIMAPLMRPREIMAPLMRPREITAEWAYRLLMRGTSRSGKPLPFEVVRCASDAISSSAGAKVVENCLDAELRENYASIRAAVIEGYRNAGKPLWEVV